MIRHYKKTYQRSKNKDFAKNIAKILGMGLLLAVFFTSILFLYFAKDLPRPERFTERPFIEPTRIYDRDGKVVLYTIYGEEKRDFVSLGKAPDHLKQAVISAEDANFYNHFGIDFRGITRAFLVNLRGGRIQGGSTISQQLIRSTFLTTERTISRKIREAILTLELERRYSKDEILEFYLNQIPFGSNAYGIEAAAQTYFSKSVTDLTIGESAVLATLIRAPSSLSPYGSRKEELLTRKDNLIDRMYSLGYLEEEIAQEAKEQEIVFSEIRHKILAPHFTMEIISYLEGKYGEEFLKEKGLRVYTSLDWDLQQVAEKAVKETSEINKLYYAYNASLVALSPQTGEILSMVGSVSFFNDPLPKGCTPGLNCLFEPYPNVAMRSRQPGSAFKPIVYATAFKNGYSDQFIVIDEQTNFGTLSNPYIPRNYDGLFRGPVTLRESLAQSLNIPSIKVLKDLAGLTKSIEVAKEMGINTLTKPPSFYGLPLVLGGGEVTLLEITSAYGVFANQGLSVSPTFVLKITDAYGNIIEETKKTPRRVLESQVAELMTDILSDNEARTPVFGSNSLLYFDNYKVSAKTGTTQNYRDGWTIGYSSSLAVGVWVGNNDNTSMRHEPGIVMAAPIWKTFLNSALMKYPPN